MNSEPTVQVFAKYPHVGQVKTRLASEAGAESAAEVHCELVERQLSELMHLPASVRVELWCTEDANAGYYKMLFDRWPRLRYCRQAEGNLGERLSAALARSTRHSGKVLQIGTDCPVLQCTQIMKACKLLAADTDTVFIPAEDGGYVLGAYNCYRAGLFDHIEWSSSRVMSQVLVRLSRLGLSAVLMPTMWDIDHLADLQRYRSLQSGCPSELY